MKLQIYSYEGDLAEANVFFGGDLNNVIAVLANNDVTWKAEYLDPILKGVGVEVQHLTSKDIPIKRIEEIIEEWWGL